MRVYIVSHQKLASQAQLPNFCRKTGVFLQKRSKPCDPDSDSAAAKRPVSPRRHRGPFDCGLPLADFGFGINERLLYQDKPKSAIQRVLRAPPCTPCLLWKYVFGGHFFTLFTSFGGPRPPKTYFHSLWRAAGSWKLRG